jgi:nucleoside recognition membrane protein YjiH
MEQYLHIHKEHIHDTHNKAMDSNTRVQFLFTKCVIISLCAAFMLMFILTNQFSFFLEAWLGRGW